MLLVFQSYFNCMNKLAHSFAIFVLLFSSLLFSFPPPSTQAETLPLVYSRIAKICWPFEYVSDPEDSYSVFSSVMTFQLINPSSYNVTAWNGHSRIFALDVSAELFEENITVSTDTGGFAIPVSMEIPPGITNITLEPKLYFHKANLTNFPLGNYSLWYTLLGDGNFRFHAYKLYLEVTQDYVLISQEDGSFEILITDETETFDSNITTQISFPLIAAVFVLLLLVPLMSRRKRNEISTKNEKK